MAKIDSNVSWEYSDLIDAIYDAPAYHLVFEVLLIIFIVGLLFQRSFAPSRHRRGNNLTKSEEDQLIAEWQPEPLVSEPSEPIDESLMRAYNRCAVSQLGRNVEFEGGLRLLNFATSNFLDFIGEERVRDRAIKTLRHYGVGSCGPRGFYGTMDVHLQLEEQVTKFFNCEEAALYSYGFSTIASAIPSYAKRHDIIFADEYCCFATQKGLEASRSKVHFFRHNDVKHLEELLQHQAQLDKKDPKKAKVTRKFILVEGLYVNCGDLCPLPDLVRLKYKYKVRLFIEESASLGTLGSSGRGVCEHFGIDVADVDLIAAGIESALATQGGVVIGSKYVVDHQRLSGLGYCFSASLPPMLAAAASEAFTIMDEEAGERTRRLQRVSKKLHSRLQQELGQVWSVSGDAISPIKHLRLATANSQHTLDKVCKSAEQSGLLLTVARYLPQEHKQPQPSIRLCVNCNHTADDLDKLVTFLAEQR